MNKARIPRQPKNDIAFTFDDDEEMAPPGEAMPLITLDADRFRVHEGAVARLGTIEAPVAVVTIAGLYRTGKSFLLNRVILQRKGAFAVGNTTNACTKGIWMWSEPLQGTDEQGRKVNIIVVDTEGIGATSADATHDTRIFALGVLLSTYFVYNSKSTIDEQALNNMSLVTNLSKEIRVNVARDAAEADDAPLQHAFPAFMWVVRDFQLQMCDEQGRSITSKQYLENILRDTEHAAKNRVRTCLREFFPERDCYTMVQPVTAESELQTLDTLPDKSLRPEFRKQAEELRERIKREASRRPNKINDYELSGSMVALLCKQYVQAINEGQVPVIQDAWSYVCDAQRAKSEEKLTADFHTALQQLVTNASITTPTLFTTAAHDLLDKTLDDFESACLRLFPHDDPAGHRDALHTKLSVFTTASVRTFLTQYQASLQQAVTNALRDVEAAMGNQEYKEISEFRKAVHAKYADFSTKYVDREGDEHLANAAWYSRVEPFLWRIMIEHYGLREQQCIVARAEAERLQAQLAAVGKEHLVSLKEKEKALRDEFSAKQQAHEHVVEQLEADLESVRRAAAATSGQLQELQTHADAASSESASRIAALLRELDREKLRANTAEQEVEKLQEEIDELMQDGSVLEDVERRLADMTAERDKFREEAARTKKALQESKMAKDEMHAQFTKEAQDIQARLVQSLRQLKEKNARAQEQLRVELDEERSKRSSQEARARALQDELRGCKTQLDEKQSIYEEQTAALRAQLDDNMSQLRLKEREHLDQRDLLERRTKEKERENAQLSAEMTSTRRQLEQDYGARLEDATRRANYAEEQVRDLEKKLGLAENRNERQRKRMRPGAREEDEEGGNRRLVEAETELRLLKQQKQKDDKDLTDYKQQTEELRRTVERLQAEVTQKEFKISNLTVQLEMRAMSPE